MVGLGVDNQVEPSRLCVGLNVGYEGRERSQCWLLGVGSEHLDEWGRLREKLIGRRKMQRFSLEHVTFAMMDLVFCGRPCISPWSYPSHSQLHPVLKDLHCRTPWRCPTVMSQEGPTRRCKLGHLFTSRSELVSVADIFIENGRIRSQGTQDT